jgi:release factor glutamine methyltransferase
VNAAATVRALLAAAGAAGIERLDAGLLLGHVLGRTRAWLVAHDDDGVDADAAARFQALCQRRTEGEPLAYLTGEREFHGLSLQVGPQVLVPRPDTETLVDWALELLRGPLRDRPQPAVVDLGTGSGAIALAIKHACPGAQLTATDRSDTALQLARRNAERHGLPIAWRCGDWWAACSGACFDLAVSNPPYIATGDPHLPALRFEPLEALVPGDADGLEALRRLIEGAASCLKPGAWLLLEHGAEQAAAVRSMLEAAGFTDAATRADLAGLPRCSGARWPGGD